MVMPHKTHTYTHRGQSRILEAVIGAVIIFLVFTASYYLIQSSSSIPTQETADLNRLCYNVLHRIVESDTIEETLETQDSTSGAASLQMVVREALPQGIYFNLTVYNCTGNPQTPFAPNPVSVSNAPEAEMAKSKEVSSTSTTYTSKNGNIYLIILKTARAGQG